MSSCRSSLVAEDFKDLASTFASLEGSTKSLCRGPGSLPVLAVDLQKSCDLLQVRLPPSPMRPRGHL